jgi:hypothetical protein
MSTMRRFLTWGLIAAVAALALAAGIDALRGGAGAENLIATEGEPPATTAPAEPHDDPFVAARADLQAAGVPEGRLTYAGWSPHERWIAEATEGGIVVFRTNGETPEVIRIPVVASDLLWEDVP